jgi:hypothetical protein
MGAHNSSSHGLSAEYHDQSYRHRFRVRIFRFSELARICSEQSVSLVSNLHWISQSTHLILSAFFFFVGCFTKLSVARLYSGELYNDRRIGKDLEGSGRGVIEVLSWEFSWKD